MAQVAERHEAYLAEYGRFVKTRGGSAPAWLRELRERGAARFTDLGFPTVRNEDWRFTNVAPIADTGLSAALRHGRAAVHQTGRSPWSLSAS